MKRITKYEPSKDSMFPYKLVDNELSTELDAMHQLGRIEDLMQEYNINSIKELEILINSHKKLGEKIIDLSADLGMFQNENINLTKDIEKYWNLEEKLGCPLEVIVNILLGKRPEIVVNYADACGYEPLYEQLTETTADAIIDGCYHNCLCIETNLCEIPIKDYHKNWWLKGEKDD